MNEYEATWDSFPSLRSTTPFSVVKFKKYLCPNAIIVDLGCGYGRICYRLEKAGYSSIIGVDSSDVQLSRAKKKLKVTKLIKSNVTSTIFTDDSVDGVITFGVMSSIVDFDDLASTVKEIHRIMKPDGFWFFNDFTRNDSPLFDEKYKKGLDKYGVLRQFDSNSGMIFRHYSISELITIIDPYFNLIECSPKYFNSMHLRNKVAGCSMILQKLRHISPYR